MKTYDGLRFSFGTHTIKVSLQNKQYKGHFTCKIGGNCKGMNILESCCYEEQIDEAVKTDCEIIVDDDYFIVTLTDPINKDTCEYELDDSEFREMIVGVEIVEFIPEETEGKTYSR